MEYVADTFNKDEEIKDTKYVPSCTEAIWNKATKDESAFAAAQPEKERSQNFPMGEFNALKWSEEFVRLHGDKKITVDLVLPWFACSIMTGYDKRGEIAQKEEKEAEADCLYAFRMGKFVGYEHGYIDGGIYGWNAAIQASHTLDALRKTEAKIAKKDPTPTPQEEIQNFGNIDQDYNI